MRSGSENGSGRSKTEWTMAKMAVLAAMQSASVDRVVSVKPRSLHNRRVAKRRSCASRSTVAERLTLWRQDGHHLRVRGNHVVVMATDLLECCSMSAVLERANRVAAQQGEVIPTGKCIPQLFESNGGRCVAV